MNDLTEELMHRILVLPPTNRDGTVSRGLFSSNGIQSLICSELAELCLEARRGAGAALVTAEAIVKDREGILAQFLRDQPPWSDFPLLVLTPQGVESPKLLKMLEKVGSMTLVKRPIQVSTLISVVRAALRARHHQYEVRDLLAERVRQSEILREERERYRVTLASIGDAIIATDTNNQITFLNQVAEHLTGWQDADAKNLPIDDVFQLLNQISRQKVKSPSRNAVDEGKVKKLANNTILVSKDGTERPLEDSAAPILGTNGQVIGSVIVFRDITERKRTEDSLARDAMLLANVHDAIVMINRDGIVTYWNDGATRLFGWNSQEMSGKRYAERFAEPMRTWVTAEIRSRMAGTQWAGEYEDVRKDGSRIWVDSRVTAICDSSNHVIGVLWLAHDITERKKAEEALKETDRKKDDFIALLAHELRNPLAPLRNGLQIIRHSADRGSRQRSQEIMDRQLTHMVRLIDDLLDVSRINRNKMELRRERILLSDAINTAVETARPAIEIEKHDLHIDLPKVELYLDADLTRLAQIFANLLTNSAKYTPAGGKIELIARRENHDVIVSVRDTGIGIPVESLPHIFDMFAQLDRSLERSSGGLGIGLALVKGLVEMHGGTVEAKSDGINHGSEFIVRLPLHPTLNETTIDHPTPSTGAVVRPGRKILVVDDNRDSAESMAEMLRLFGNEVHTAFDGLDAFEQANTYRPAGILMDIGMPKLNGLDATRKIREQAWGQDIVIIALTGWGQESDRSRSKEAGCNGHLVKPVSLSDLQNLLDHSFKVHVSENVAVAVK